MSLSKSRFQFQTCVKQFQHCEQGILSPSQRNGVVTLLPKKDRDPNFVKNYRPISLLTTDYKLIAKTMANRLKVVLDDLIHEDQNGFMKGRNIGCNIRTIIDLIEWKKYTSSPRYWYTSIGQY